MKSYDTLSIVVPVFNEQETIEYTFKRLVHLQGSLSQKLEIIFINDGSSDQTVLILQELIQKESGGLKIRCIEFSRNFGHSAAVLAGLEASNADLTAIIDADLQDPPELIPKMIEVLIRENVDVVYGKRQKRESESFLKKFTAWGFYRLINFIAGVDIPNDTGDFRVITRKVREAVISCKEHEPFLRGLVAWVGFRQKPFLYVREGRKFGTTKYSWKKMLRFASIAITSFSAIPLRLSLYLGICGIFICAIFAIWGLGSWLHGNTVPGWASLLVALNFLQSLAFILMGIHGVYLGRVYVETMSRPRYLVREVHTNEFN